jgi:protease-4
MILRVRWLAVGALACGFLASGRLRAEEEPTKSPAAATKAPEAKEKPAEKKPAEKAVVAVFKLNGTLTEAPAGDDLFSGVARESLRSLVERLKKAKGDAQVKAVALILESPALGQAQVEEVRQALEELRAAGKEVYAHADSLETGGYVLVAGANKISLVPTGDLWLTGLYGSSPYLRGLLDKLGVRPDFLTCGTYKSAAEMFMRSGPSPEAEAMQNWLLDSMYRTDVELIAKGRGVSATQVKAWIDAGPYTASAAKELGLIDAVQFRQDFVADLKSKFGDQVKLDTAYAKKKGPELDLSSPFAGLKLWADILQGPKAKTSNKDSIAIVYVDGAIMLGDAVVSPLGGSEGAYSTPLRKALDKVAADDKVKAVVLRVNSPGGSATASEIILDATRRVKAKKPLVVSMGDVAASGGYYVACAADTIFADQSTITGSIGVVGGKFATTDLWNKIGVHWKSYARGANAGLLGGDQVFTDSERRKIQGWMDEIYAVFKGHVLAIRGKRLKKALDDLAGGRVYTGQQALELGLIDKIGTLADALAYAASEAKVSDYEVRVEPQPKNFLELLFEDLGGKREEGVDISLAPAIRRSPLFEAALPLLEGLDPGRARAIRAALAQLEAFRRERVMLVMPVFVFGK